MTEFQEELQAATYASLRAHATSEQAKALVATLSSMVDEHTITVGLRKKRRKGTAGKLEYATGAFLADLLRPLDADEPNGWVYRSLKKAAFTGAAVTRRTFEQLYEGLKGLAFLDHVPGHKVAKDRYEDGTQYASRFRATPALLRFCTEQGVEPTKAGDHFEFEYDLPKHPIEKRARKEKHWYSKTKPTGKVMEFEKTDHVEFMENSIRELNAYFAKRTLRGGAHHGYVRIFSNGDDPDFDWNKGGRFYSQHVNDSYQAMSGTRRRMMTINGEPVVEIDIRASYLTIFLSMHGIQLDATKDPYELQGFGQEHRTAVKQWFTGTFGNTKPIRRWPSDMLKDEPTLSRYRVASITEAVMAKYPALATWGQPLNGRILSWADLMFLESDVMFGAMLNLMHIHDTPSLSVHDSLIVPASKAEKAEEAMTMSFHAKQRVEPLLKINQPIFSEEGGPRGEAKGETGARVNRGGLRRGLMVVVDCRSTQVHRDHFLSSKEPGVSSVLAGKMSQTGWDDGLLWCFAALKQDGQADNVNDRIGSATRQRRHRPRGPCAPQRSSRIRERDPRAPFPHLMAQTAPVNLLGLPVGRRIADQPAYPVGWPVCPTA